MEFLEARPESLSDVTLVVPIAVAFAVLVVAAALLQPKRPRAVVSKLFVYPIKGCAGQELQSSSEFDKNGFLQDRRYMFVRCVEGEGDADSFQHQRIHPRMGLIRPSYVNGGLMLRAEGMPDTFVPLVGPKDAGAKLRTVRVWDTKFTGAVDQGDAAADFVCQFLKTFNLRLVHMPESCVRPVPSKFKKRGTANTTSFADGFPFLLISEESLDKLRSRVQLPALDMRRFRPNIVVRGTFPNAEDRWTEVTINKNTMYGVKKCTRCKYTTINPDDASCPDPEGAPLTTLRTYRAEDDGTSVCFGLNLIPRWSKRSAKSRPTVSVGDEVIVQDVGFIPYR